MKTQRDCATCGAPVGIRDRVLCCRCWRREREDAAKTPCPACGKRRVLTATGRCVTCSRTCVDCGATVLPRDRVRCQHCHRRHRNASRPACRGCHRPRRLSDDGLCGTCAAARRPRRRLACVTCGAAKVTRAGIACNACWQRDPVRPFVYAAGLAQRLDNPPQWLDTFAAYAAARFCPSRASLLLRDLGRLHADGATTPTALLDAARWPGRSMGPLARTLEEFFVEQRLALPLGQTEQREQARRARRVAATPEPFRDAVAAYANAQLAWRDRARRAGTRPTAHPTIDIRLCSVRDLARFLVDTRPNMTGWETVSIDDLEAFLALRPASRSRQLSSLRTFFVWARRQRLVLTDPTAKIPSNRRRGFIGPVLDPARQRALLRRWTTDTDIHPHEALVGLASMLHAASSGKLRDLRIDEIDHTNRTVRLGRRPSPVPLDPATWQAVQRCLEHRERLDTPNPT